MSIVTAVQGHPKGEAASALAARVNDKLDGRMCMEVYGNAELYDDDAVLEAVLAGDVQMAAPSLSKFEAYTKAFRLFDLPFLFDGPLAALNYQNSEAGQRLRSALDPAGFSSLGFWTNGMKQISAVRPLRRPKDAEGLTFRIQPSPVIEAQFAALGANTKTLAFSKVYGALESGEVQGQQNTWSNIYTRKFFTQQDGVTESNHAYLGYMVVTSQAFLDGLDPEVRDEFLLLFELTTHEYNRFAFEINQLRAQDVWRETKAIVELTDEERAEWRAAFAPVYDAFAAEIGAERIAEAQSFNGN
ncbi:MAG: DctP family TRAP transporter solute-binding subunit [Pseudomonadota bacterium]